MQWCSREEALLNLFYNLSSLSSTLLLFYFLLNTLISQNLPFFQRTRADHGLSEEEEEEEEGGGGVRFQEESNVYYRVEDAQETDLVADVVLGGEALLFCNDGGEKGEYRTELEDGEDCKGQEDGSGSSAEEEISSDPPLEAQVGGHRIMKSTDMVGENGEKCFELVYEKNGRSNEFQQTRVEQNQKFRMLEGGGTDVEEIYGDSCMVGSTSKSSSEWRSSITCGTDESFSSSSRRSCPKWESYTVFQKYDEEMMFLDRISAQKLHETESLRSMQVCPRSISERIILKISTMNRRPSNNRNNPYSELEAAYVAQICLTWEALNWNYKNFQSKRSKETDFDHGCPAHVAQQFQQFQVLLQRYVENEPYEQGRRPEVYARMRLLAPKLLQVPGYHDSEDEQQDEGFRPRISSATFAMIIEDGICTFMSFLKIDKERTRHKLAAFFKRKKWRNGVNPASIALMRKVNHNKKAKLKDLRRDRGCLKKRRLGADESMEVLMALIDLKVVSRVLRMRDITKEQLQWCEEKTNRVKILQGKLQRDSTPLFFPAH